MATKMTAVEKLEKYVDTNRTKMLGKHTDVPGWGQIANEYWTVYENRERLGILLWKPAKKDAKPEFTETAATMPYAERRILVSQHRVMGEYADILNRRLAAMDAAVGKPKKAKKAKPAEKAGAEKAK